MSGIASVADWYYIGHYGQLGPLTRDQIDELIQGGVITRETYVWHSGMADWLLADRVNELSDCFSASQPFGAPPPPPGAKSSPPRFGDAPASPYGTDFSAPNPSTTGIYGYGRDAYLPVASDRSRVAAGILQIILPGIGRIYLGYAAVGVLQLVLMFCGIGFLWSWIDGILILAGTPKVDGYGRLLAP